MDEVSRVDVAGMTFEIVVGPAQASGFTAWALIVRANGVRDPLLDANGVPLKSQGPDAAIAVGRLESQIRLMFPAPRV